MMADSNTSYENAFSEWLAKQVSPAQLSVIYLAFTGINSFCLSRKILKKPLFETDDLATLSSVRETVERGRVFAFCYRKQKSNMIAAIRYYYRFIKELKDNGGLIKSEHTSDDKPENSEQEAPRGASLLDFLEANHIPFVDNRPKNGCLWIIGGVELKTFVDRCSAYGVVFRFKAGGVRATKYSPAWWTTDDFDSATETKSALSAEENIPESKAPLAASSGKSNRLKFIEWLDKRGVPSGDVFAVLSALKRCAERVKAEKIIDDDIYCVTSSETMDAIRSFLLKSKDFREVDRYKGNRLTNALNLYCEFFNEQRTEPIAEPKLEKEPFIKTTTQTPSEIDMLLGDEVFLPLKRALAKENIYTIEELKELKLWAFMNRNNLYSIPMRQTILAKVRQLLEPEETEKPELLYEIHCGSAVYVGDTLAKAFLRFCEGIAQKYPLFFRSLLDKSIGSTSGVKIYRFPGSGNFIRMENPACYISTDIAKDSIIAAVEWIMQRCVNVTVAVSIKEPETHAEMPQEELPDVAQNRQNSEPIVNDAGEQRLRFDGNDSLAYTMPTGFSYKGKAVSCTFWNELYVKLVCELYNDYNALFQHDMHFAGSRKVDLGSKAGMTCPRKIKNDVYLECNVSATEIVEKIRWLLNYCSGNTDDVIITYRRWNSGSVQRASQQEESNTHITAVRSTSSQESEREDAEQIAKVEKIVFEADADGVTYDDLYGMLKLTMAATKALVQRCKHIVEMKGKLYHEEAFVDWDDGARQMCLIMEKLMQKNDGYVSAEQLYDYARTEMNMFLNDNDANDERSVYEMAQHLFEKNSFEGKHYSFTGKSHISKSGEEAISSIFDVICKFAEAQGGVFQEDDLTEYLAGVGIKTRNVRSQMRLGKEPDFFFYEPGTFISAKSMGIDSLWKETVGKALYNLLSDADGHIILRQIQPVWYDSLPALPKHRRWTPLLLQYVLRFYGKELGAKTIMAMKGQSMDTLHAMLVKDDGPIQNFGDAVVAYLIESEIEQRTFGAEELRQLLGKAGMIHGNELIWNMPKALAKDERFSWDAEGENVTVRV